MCLKTRMQKDRSSAIKRITFEMKMTNLGLKIDPCWRRKPNHVPPLHSPLFLTSKGIIMLFCAFQDPLNCMFWTGNAYTVIYFSICRSTGWLLQCSLCSICSWSSIKSLIFLSAGETLTFENKGLTSKSQNILVSECLQAWGMQKWVSQGSFSSEHQHYKQKWLMQGTTKPFFFSTPAVHIYNIQSPPQSPPSSCIVIMVSP